MESDSTAPETKLHYHVRFHFLVVPYLVSAWKFLCCTLLCFCMLFIIIIIIIIIIVIIIIIIIILLL